jgi:hypothetical protein
LIMLAAAGAEGGHLPDPNGYASVGWLLVCLVAVITGANQIHDFWQRIQAKPSPGEVQAAARELYVEKPVFDRTLAEQEAEAEAISAKVEEHRKAAEASRDRLYDHVGKKIGEVNTEIRRIHERMDNLPSQIVALLSNTKVIK